MVQVMRIGTDLSNISRGGFVEVRCTVLMSPLKKPLFECRIPQLDKSFIAIRDVTIDNVT